MPSIGLYVRLLTSVNCLHICLFSLSPFLLSTRPLKESNTHWVEELDSILWGLRTTPNRTTGYTPFFMVYGAEAVLPCDIIHDSPRVRMYEEKEAELDRQESLDALEEERDVQKPVPHFINNGLEGIKVEKCGPKPIMLVN